MVFKKCSLCENEISNYSKKFNHLKIDDGHTYEICQNCMDKIIKWQQDKFTNLFPTSALKKKLKENK